MLSRGAIRCAALALAAATATAQAAWRAEPVMWPRTPRALAFEPGSGRTYVFGGNRQSAGTDTIWAWDGATWSAVGTMPGLQPGPSVAYDQARQRFVAAWESGPIMRWDPPNWTLLQGGPQLTSGDMPRLVYDPLRQVTMLYNSRPGQAVVWDWNGSVWTQRTFATIPPWGNYRLIARAPAPGVLQVLYEPVTNSVQTWLWNNVDWQQVTTAHLPPPLQWFDLARDPATGNVLLWGGYEAIGGFAQSRDQLWSFDGVDWQQLTPPASPRARSQHAMTNGPNGNVLMYGGITFANGVAEWLGDLWQYDGATWTWLAEMNSPFVTGNLGAGVPGDIVFVRGAQRNVLYSPTPALPTPRPLTQTFDGRMWRTIPCNGVCPAAPVCLFADESLQSPVAFASNGTFLWVDPIWFQVAASGAGPSPRTGAAAAWDGRRVILFGGLAGNQQALGDTWAWSGLLWTQLQPTTSPPPSFNHRMAGMPSRGGVLMRTGTQTWWWDGTTWSPRPGVPVMPYDGALAWLPERDRVVQYGGTNPATLSQSTATWEWDGNAWQQTLAAGPSSPPGARLVEVPGQRLAILPSVPSDLMSFGSVTPALLEPYGVGCLGSSGAPRLSGDAWQRAHLGESFTLDLSAVAATPAVLAVGFHADVWSGAPLPLDLGAVGMPGCAALLAPEAWLFAFTDFSGRARWSITVPAQPALLGLDWFAQAIAVDPPANAGGLVVSNGLHGRIGQR